MDSEKEISEDEYRKKNTFMSFLLLVLFIPAMFWNGFCLSKVWWWTLHPMFGIQGISIWEAMALVTVVSFFRGNVPTGLDTEEQKFRHTCGVITMAFTKPLILLGTGYVLSHYIQ